MSTAYVHPDLVDLLRAVEVQSPTRFTLNGELRDLTRLKLLSPSGEGRARPQEPLLQALESDLYNRFYCRPRTGKAPTAGDPAALREFIGALSRANCGNGTWEPGWVVAAVEPDGRIAVTKDRVAFWARPAQVRCPGASVAGAPVAGTPAAGAPCEVRLAKEIRHLFPAFYMALGDTLPDGAPLLRLYWNLTPTAATRYMRLATARLNGAGIPFRTKVLSNPQQYLRADAGVLYVRRTDFGRLRPIVAQLYGDLRASLLDGVPRFTKALAPGLGLAEDPGGGRSFGQSRCRIAAEALQRCQAGGVREPEARLRLLAEVFRQRGVDPLRPYLDAGSVDDYALEVTPGKGEG